MICLDANYLIRGVALQTDEAAHLVRWIQEGVQLTTASVAWFEFLCGPVIPPQIRTMREFLSQEPLPFLVPQAREAARLFNAVKRVRRLRVDAMIAATAILADATLATSNTADFQCFVPYGLKLWKQK
jgi:predicted nucleic acid-binding protein